jgi:hypothetical protein
MCGGEAVGLVVGGEEIDREEAGSDGGGTMGRGTRGSDDPFEGFS